MKQFNKISDEELAAYLDDMLSYDDFFGIESDINIDTLEVLSVSRKAISKFQPNNIFSVPFEYSGIKGSITPLNNPFPMAGFLGECNIADCNCNDMESDDNDEE